MPISEEAFEELRKRRQAGIFLPCDPITYKNKILMFLRSNKGGYTKQELSNLVLGGKCPSTALTKLKKGGLVEHEDEYWKISNKPKPKEDIPISNMEKAVSEFSSGFWKGNIEADRKSVIDFSGELSKKYGFKPPKNGLNAVLLELLRRKYITQFYKRNSNV